MPDETDDRCACGCLPLPEARRKFALSLAVSTSGAVISEKPEQTVERAKAYEAFLKGSAERDEEAEIRAGSY